MRYRAVEARSRTRCGGRPRCTLVDVSGALPGRGAAAGTTSRAGRAPPRAGRRNARPTARSARPRSSSRSRSWRRRGRGLPCSLRRPWARRPSRGPWSRPSARPATGVVSLGAPGHARVAQGDAAARLRAWRRVRALAAAAHPRRRRRAPGRRVARRSRRRELSVPAPEAARPRAPRARAPARAPGARRPRRAHVPVARGRRPARIISVNVHNLRD